MVYWKMLMSEQLDCFLQNFNTKGSWLWGSLQ